MTDNGRYSLKETRAQKFFLVYIYMETYMHACLAQDIIKMLPDATFILKAHRCFAQRSSQLRYYYLYFQFWEQLSNSLCSGNQTTNLQHRLKSCIIMQLVHNWMSWTINENLDEHASTHPTPLIEAYVSSSSVSDCSGTLFLCSSTALSTYRVFS